MIAQRIVTLAIAAVAGLALTSPAHAASITLSGGTPGSIPGGAENNFIPGVFTGPLIGGYYGTNLLVDAPEPSRIVFDFFGAEAGYTNWFEFGGSTLFTHNGGLLIAPGLGAPLATYETTIHGSGLLSFRFIVDNGAGSVTNGSNPDDSAGASLGPNIFATCNPLSGTAGAGGTECQSVYLFLDDGGAGPDDNHDDFLVRIYVGPVKDVPEPAALGLLGLGLAGWAHRRRRQ